jgi:hypothetical protein
VIMHHVQHLVMYSLLLWQAALAGWFLLKWCVKNIKFYSREATPIIIEGGNSSNQTVPWEQDAQVTTKKEIDIDSFVNVKASIPKAKVGTTSLKSEKQKVKDTGVNVAKKLKKLRGKK